MINKTAGVIGGVVLILGAAVLYLSFDLPGGWAIVMATIGFFAMSDGMDNSDQRNIVQPERKDGRPLPPPSARK